MQKEKVLVPKLRFSEFEDEWKKIRLGDFIQIKSGNSPSSFDFIEEGKYPFIKVEELNNCDKYQFNSRFYSNSTKNLVAKNSILFPKRGAAILNNKIRISSIPLLMDSNMMALECDNSKLNFEFLYYKILKEKLYKIADTSTIPQLNNKHIQPYKLYVSSLPEQQKIANFLTSIDNQIQTLEKKKSLLEQYKKGVMQKIFKQELRFKDEDGNAFPEWEFVKLKEVLKRSKLKNTDVKVKYILTNSATQGIVSQNDYFDKDIANQNNLQGYYIVEKDDFIYNPRISQFAPVGPLKRNKLAQGVMSPLYTVLRPKKGNLEFLEFYFGTTLWHKYMKAIANYGARHDRMNITMTDFENLPIPFPSLEEQTKIANFLSAIDKNITLVNTKIEQTKAYKKGLLQQLFV